MIDEVLASVHNAEEQAEKIRSEADERASGIRQAADKRAAEISESARKNAKAVKNDLIYAAGLKAEEDFEATVSGSRAECEKLKLSLDAKAEELSIEILRRLTDGDC